MDKEKPKLPKQTLKPVQFVNPKSFPQRPSNNKPMGGKPRGRG